MGLVKYLIAILLILIPATSLADTHNAASCSSADVTTAIAASVNGDTVTIPVGTCTWTSGITITKNITLQGAGMDSTVITQSGNVYTISLGTTSTRVTGIGFYHTVSQRALIYAQGTGWRVDHCRFDNESISSQTSIVADGKGTTAQPTGLVDNNIFINGKVLVEGSNSGRPGALQNTFWAEAITFGDDDAVYIEDNTFTRTDGLANNNALDSNTGGQSVFRYNTLSGTYIMVHSVQATTGRGTKKWEAYGNIIEESPITTMTAPIWFRGGTGFIFNNSIIGTYSNNGVAFDNVRSVGTTYPTSDNTTLAGRCDGDNDYDGNTSGQSGWPCRDQIGRGYDVSLLTVGSTPYPAQVSVPAYVWSNIRLGSQTTVSIRNSCGTWIQSDRDYYEYKSGFDGTSGVGCGTLASRPATCTTGVGYWATNQSCTDMTGMVGAVDPEGARPDVTYKISGTLYKCVDNAWEETASYTPYTYPHPLRTEEDADPMVVSVYVNGAIMTINFSEAITSADNAAFTLDPSGADVTVDCPAVATGATSMACTISRALVQSETAKYAYTDTKVVDAATNPLANIGATDITGNLTPAEAPTSKLTVSKTGSGCTVTSSPSGISLGGATASDDYDFNTNTVVTLSGYSENGWNAITYGGDCAANGTVTMNAAKECTATCTQVQLFP